MLANTSRTSAVELLTMPPLSVAQIVFPEFISQS